MTSATATPLQQSVSLRTQWRRASNVIMLALLTVAMIIALVPLVAVLAYVLVNGIPGLSLTLFTQLPRPVDVGAGGMANSMVGSLLIGGIGSALGIVFGMSGGIYLAEFGHGVLAWSVRFFCGRTERHSVYHHWSLRLCAPGSYLLEQLLGGGRRRRPRDSDVAARRPDDGGNAEACARVRFGEAGLSVGPPQVGCCASYPAAGSSVRGSLRGNAACSRPYRRRNGAPVIYSIRQ